MSTRVVNLRKEEFNVYIGRKFGKYPDTKWGNPFKVGYDVTTKGEAVTRYRAWIETRPDLKQAARDELKGKILGCWCKPGPCHGDVLQQIADAPDPAVPDDSHEQECQ